VAALTKNPAVGDKPAQMRDSLERICQCSPEVWMVKLADRINNLREPPH
jgi:(p)ppGpp synthase/HD superfamily hydrolase